MIGIPRPKPGKCPYCDDFAEKVDVDIPYWTDCGEEDIDTGGFKEIDFPETMKPYVQLSWIWHGEEAVPHINAAVQTNRDGKTGWLALEIEVRYCPYCGRDLWEELNGEDE